MGFGSVRGETELCESLDLQTPGGNYGGGYLHPWSLCRGRISTGLGISQFIGVLKAPLILPSLSSCRMREYERPTSLAACCAVMYGKGMATSRCSNHSVAYRLSTMITGAQLNGLSFGAVLQQYLGVQVWFQCGWKGDCWVGGLNVDGRV